MSRSDDGQVHYEVELISEGYRPRSVSRNELPKVYADLPQRESPTVSWGDISEGGVVIVQVTDDYSATALGVDGTFYWLVETDEDEEVMIDLGGTDSMVPKGALAPRERGLEVLLAVDDLAALRTEYIWVAQ